MKHQEFYFDFYNTKFYGQYWEALETKAIVVLAHGMGEHSGRYHHVAKKLTENQYSVVAFDHFGHGKTAGKRGHNPNFEAVLSSVSIVIEKAKELFPKKPVFLYGHSMGGNVVLNYVLRKNTELNGVIATSPFLKLAFNPPAIKLFAGKLLQNIAPSLTMGNELDVNALSRDANEVQKYIKDDLVHNKISPNYSIKFIETGSWAIENANSLTVASCIFHGDSDKITSHLGSQEFADNSNLAEVKIYKNGYHELHNDLCAAEMLQDVVDWLNSRL